MMDHVRASLSEADIVALLVDVTEEFDTAISTSSTAAPDGRGKPLRILTRSIC